VRWNFGLLEMAKRYFQPDIDDRTHFLVIEEAYYRSRTDFATTYAQWDAML